MAPWRIITGFGLDNWIYWHLLYNLSLSQSITTAHNQWLPKTRSILTGLRLSSILVFLLLWLNWFWFTNHSLLLYEWIPNDECRRTNELRTTAHVRLNYPSVLTCPPFITLGSTEGLHGVRSKMVVPFIVTAVRTWNTTGLTEFFNTFVLLIRQNITG
jgi:hypothetical protein